MGPITEAMTRLVGEIKAGHAARVSFVKDMRQEVATMRKGFRRANEKRVREVAALLAGFRHEHKERAREVMALRQEVAADLAGARRAWFGPTPAERRAMAQAERRAREQAERERRDQEEEHRRAQEEAERRLAAAAEEAETPTAAKEAETPPEAEEVKEAEPERKGPAKKK